MLLVYTAQIMNGQLPMPQSLRQQTPEMQDDATAMLRLGQRIQTAEEQYKRKDRPR
jgi:hypothetical protein